jgi:DNA-binding response OmpR family regulator
LLITDSVPLASATRTVLEANGFDTLAPMGPLGSFGSPETPDLILLDLMLTGSSGLGAYRQLKADATLGSVPVLAMASMMLNIDELVELHIAEAGDFLVKPFSSDELLHSIHCALS